MSQAAVSSSQSQSQRSLNPFEEGDISYDESLGRADSTRRPSLLSSISYNATHFAETWLYIAVLCHLIQFSILLGKDSLRMSIGFQAVTALLVVAVPLLLLYARLLVTKKKVNKESAGWLWLPSDPEEETDIVPDNAIYSVSAASVLEGVLLAVFSISVAGHEESQSSSDRSTVLQALRFASITLLSFHRILRPANRVDPMRTVMELEVVNVCWDALDGSTLFELLDSGLVPGLRPLSPSEVSATRFLMGFWYVSVGFRLAFMFLTHLSTASPLYRGFYLHLLPTPLQAMRVRSIVVMVMSLAELYAMVLRIELWARGCLDTTQQEMALKNIMFLASAYSAYDMWTSTVSRSWNSRALFAGLKIPTRDSQRAFLKWCFVVSFVIESALLTAFVVNLAEGDGDSKSATAWAINVLVDAVLLLVFVFYCAKCHVKSTREAAHWLLPQRGFVIFPGRLVGGVSSLLMLSLYLARVPTIYSLLERSAGRPPWTLPNATLILSVSVVTIASLGMYLSLSYMLFEREFTTAPDNYHAIHDPTINVVCSSMMTEGCLDVLSASTFVSLASYGLPRVVNGGVQMFALLELGNACQSFALQALLSGGHNDTPGDLVKWKARIRASRAVIDFGCFVLRVTLWVQYDAVSSVFLVKNVYNLIHSVSMVERAAGVDKYSQTSMFMEYVPSYEWYGMTPDQWKHATATTLIIPQASTRRI